MCKKFLINHVFAAPYHPQTNKIVERLNWTLCNSLVKVKKKDEDWDIHIPAILFAYRTKRYATTGYTPFQLVYGWQAILPIKTAIPIDSEPLHYDIDLENSILYRAFELIDELSYQQTQARKNTEKSQ